MRKIRRTRTAQLSRDAQDPMLAMHAVFQNQNIAAASLTKISHNISYMKISYMKSLYGIETNFIYEMLCENFIYEIFHI